MSIDRKEKKELPAAKGVLDWSLNNKERFDMLVKERENADLKSVNQS